MGNNIIKCLELLIGKQFEDTDVWKNAEKDIEIAAS